MSDDIFNPVTNQEYEHRDVDGLYCPHCMFLDLCSEEHDLIEDEDTVVTCPHCGKEFEAVVQTYRSWYSRKTKGKE